MATDYVFFRGSDAARLEQMRQAARIQWGSVREIAAAEFRLFVRAADVEEHVCHSTDSLGVVSGYVANNDVSGGPDGILKRTHHKRFIDNICKLENWPLSDQWTGSFSAVAYSKRTRKIVLCNDLIGYIPAYYTRTRTAVLGGTSLIVLSRCLAGTPDPIGILQRVSSPYCNYGRRTLLKQISRLLPGEAITFSEDGEARSRFDDSLCKGLLDGNVDEVARQVWDCLVRETQLVIADASEASVALSGGWDSRVVLEAVFESGKAIHCYTYGSDDLYETGLASRCANLVGASHRSLSIAGKYFPSRSDLEALVNKTEAANHLQWFTIVAALKESDTKNQLILLGDHCESLDARNINDLSSREARKKSFFSELLGKAITIPASTLDAFDKWKKTKRAEILNNIISNLPCLSSDLAQEIDEASLIQELNNDLELSFSRVKANLPHFAPMFDEIFSWFHKTRYQVASQNLLLDTTFRPVSPAMSMRFLRLISTVHPRLRLRRRLMDAIARLPEFDKLARIPSAQIPWVSARTSSVIREVIWGCRSGLDQLMIGRIIRSKNPNKRQRILRSLDFIREYRRNDVEKTVREWFSGRWIKPDPYVERVTKRRDLSSWPLINLDIAAPANVSIILDLCLSVAERKPIGTHEFQEHASAGVFC